MARLSKQEVPGFSKRDDEDWNAYYARQSTALGELAKKSSAIPEGGDIKDALIKFSVADGYAYYVVVKTSPLTVAHVPFGDGYAAPAPTIRGLNRADVERQLAMDRMWSGRAQKNEDFYDSLEEGQTVHYDHGFGAWVRCVAERGTDSRTGEERMVLKPVALVGEWREYDLPKRDRDGEIRWGYQVEKIRNGDIMHPHESCLWESERGAKRQRGVVDPTGLDPIDVSGPPPMGKEEQERARLWRLVARVRDATATTLGDPREKLEAVKAIVAQA
jgi:hypothetical protein